MANPQYPLKDILLSMDIPFRVDSQKTEILSTDLQAFQLRNYITKELAQYIWLDWNHERGDEMNNPAFLEAFRNLLSEGVSMGYKISRFKEISSRLPEPTNGRRNWIPLFEEVIQECKLNVYVNEGDYLYLFSSEKFPDSAEKFQNNLTLMSDGLFYELGLIYPAINFYIEESLAPNQFRVEVNDFRSFPQTGIKRDEILVNETVDRLTLLDVTGKPIVNPANGSEASVVSLDNQSIVEQAGYTIWESDAYLVLALSAILRKNASAFVNRNFIDLLLFRLRQGFPETVSQFLDKYSKDFLVQILRGLLREEISIRNLRRILDFLSSLQSTAQVDILKYIVFKVSEGVVFSNRSEMEDLEIYEFVNAVRSHLKRYISPKYSRGQNTLVIYLVAPEFESRLQQAQPLTEEERSRLSQWIREEIGTLPPTSQPPVILTGMAIRYQLAYIVRSEYPQISVLSYQELDPGMNVQPMARIDPGIIPYNEFLFTLMDEVMPNIPVGEIEDSIEQKERYKITSIFHQNLGKILGELEVSILDNYPLPLGHILVFEFMRFLKASIYAIMDYVENPDTNKLQEWVEPFWNHASSQTQKHTFAQDYLYSLQSVLVNQLREAPISEDEKDKLELWVQNYIEKGIAWING